MIAWYRDKWFWRDLINTNTIFSLVIGVQHPPGRLILYPGTIFLKSCFIVTLLKRAPSREHNNRRDDEEENWGSGKSKMFLGISGHCRFFHGKSEFNTPPWLAPGNVGWIYELWFGCLGFLLSNHTRDYQFWNYWHFNNSLVDID